MKKLILSLLLLCSFVFAQAGIYVEAFDEQASNERQVTLRLRVVNSTEQAFNNVQLKYYLPYDANRTLQVNPYYAPNASVSSTVAGDQIEVNIDIATLNPGVFPNESGMSIGLNYADWQDFNKASNTSYPGTTSFANAKDIAIYVDGVAYNVVGPVVAPTNPAKPRFVGIQPTYKSYRSEWIEIVNFDEENTSLEGFTLKDVYGNSVSLGKGDLKKGEKLIVCMTENVPCPKADYTIINTSLHVGAYTEFTIYDFNGIPVDYIATGRKGDNADAVKTLNPELNTDFYLRTNYEDYNEGERSYDYGDFFRAIYSTTDYVIKEWRLFSARQIESDITSLPDPEPLSLSDGSIVTLFEGEEMVFSWIKIKNAKKYILTIVNKATNKVIYRQETVKTTLSVFLEPGVYAWAVEAAETGDFESTIEDLVTNIEDLTELTIKTMAYSDDHIIFNLHVSPLAARKDSYLMDLEWGTEIIHRRGDRPHNLTAYYDQFNQLQFIDPVEQNFDDEESWRCWIVSAVMLNHYYGGNITQDEIKYRVKGRKFDKIEKAFPHGESGGGYVTDSHEALEIALNLSESELNYEYGRPDEALINKALNEGRPVYIWQRRHIMLIDAARLNPEIGVMEYRFINTDNNGTYEWRVYEKETTIRGIWAPNKTENPQNTDIRIVTDTDGDGLMDFDEEERFGTYYYDPDSDGDEINDKVEILSYTSRGVKADIDNDGLRAELDYDSDNGGVGDGLEDKNHNGMTEDDETDPYVASDDANVEVPAGKNFPALYALSTIAYHGDAKCFKENGDYCDIAAAGIQPDVYHPIIFGNNTQVGNIYAFANVYFEGGAQIHGNIEFYGNAEVDPNSSIYYYLIGGSISYHDNAEWHANFPTVFDFLQFQNDNSLVVRRGTTVKLNDDDHYSFVKVENGATLEIPAGTFWVNNLQIDDGANVVFTQPGQLSTLHIDGDFFWRGTISDNEAVRNSIARSFQVQIHSYNRTYFIERDFAGRIIAPHSMVILGQNNSTLYGSLIAFRIAARQFTNIKNVNFAY